MLYIKELLLKEIIKNVESSSEECCGFLFGTETCEDRTLTRLLIAKNVAKVNRNCNFEISPQEYLEAEDFAVRNNLLLLCIYHSHPNHPAIPSTFDTLAAQPYFSYIILSVNNKKFSGIKSWRLDDNLHFKEEKLVIL